jgi:predicted nucleotidyltransferase
VGDTFEAIGSTLKKVSAALREEGVPFLLGGSLASWARGGPESRHDLDLILKPADAERALDVLEKEGLRAERPPEGWLFKAWDGDVLVDLIFAPKGLEVTDEVLERGEELEVLAIRIPVMALEDMLVTKLLALDEHSLDYSGALQIARSLREQIDWDGLRRRTEHSPYACPFFTLVRELGIAEPHGAPRERHSHVRVVGNPSQ